jgi:serine/threonine-protein phosphatase 2A activator
LTMGAVWNWTFSAGCESFYISIRLVLMSHQRICLDRLQVVTASDHTALITRVFWRFILKPVILFIAHPSQIYSNHAYTSVDVLARTRWISWRLGSRRLSFFTFPLWFCAATRHVAISYRVQWVLTSLTAGHKFVRPKAIHDPEIVDELSKDYMYFSCIKFINSVRIFRITCPIFHLKIWT